MARINWGRLLLGALIAAIIMFVTDGFIHERLVNTDWRAVYAGLRAAEPEPHGSSMVYFAIYELGRGFIVMLFYVTAALAGIAGWVAFSLTGPAQFIPLGFFSTALWVKVGALHLLISILATIAGAATYKETRQPARA
jgi:hypothetical protein